MDSQVSVSKLEEHLGVDRYLDRIAEFELSSISEMLNRQRKLIEQKTEPIIRYFQDNWANDNIPDMVYHKLYKYDEENQLCTLTQTNQKKVILFMYGLGFTMQTTIFIRPSGTEPKIKGYIMVKADSKNTAEEKTKMYKEEIKKIFNN